MEQVRDRVDEASSLASMVEAERASSRSSSVLLGQLIVELEVG